MRFGLILKLLALLGTAGVGFGMAWTVQGWRLSAASSRYALERAELAQQIQTEKARQAAVSERVVTKYLPSRERVRTLTKEVIREVPVLVSPDADAGCVLPVGFVYAYDASACGRPLPDAAPGSYDAPSGVELSAATGAIVQNNGSCNEIRLQLLALQEWVKGVSNGK